MTPTNAMIRRDEFLERPLPSSEESERVILGSILIDDSAIIDAAAGLEPDDLYSPSNKRIYAAMLELHEAKRPIDPILIGEVLKREGSLEAIGGVPAITNLSWGVPPRTDITQFIEIVRQHAQVRKLIRACNEIITNAASGQETAESVLATAQVSINDICTSSEAAARNERFIPLDRIIHHDVLPGLEALARGETMKLPTGFEKIDAMIGGGLSTSDVLLLAGLPGSGKSALALQMVYQIANSGTPCAFLAGEMTNRENVNRLLSQVSGMMNVNSLVHLSETDHQFLTEWAYAIRNVPLYFDSRTCDLQTLGAHLRSIVRQHGVKVLVIDYIQLLKVERVDRRHRNERIAEASQEVKRLANELDIAIIEVAQFNRDGAKSGKPGMFDLEGSGQLEKDASLVFIIDRDEVIKHHVTLRIVKGRNTGNGEIPGTFRGHCLKFEF